MDHVSYQTIVYDDRGMFQAKLMDETQVQIFIDNGATPSIFLLNTYNKYPLLRTYPKTESNTPIHTGGSMIESHFWIEIPLKLDNQAIQIKALVCDSECQYDIVLGCTSLAQLSTWQDYASRQLYIQQISIPLIAKNNVRILPGNTGIVSLVLKLSKTSFTPCHTFTGKGIAYVRPFQNYPCVINFQALLPHMYGGINKLFQCFVELVLFYFIFAHNIYSKLHQSQVYLNIFKVELYKVF